MKVLITGGSGFVGQKLTKRLLSMGYDVAWLSRSALNNAPVPVFQWDVSKGKLELAALDYAEHVIHLAGAGIADKRWTVERRRVIFNSRVGSAKLLHKYCKKGGVNPKVVVSASGTGFYGQVTNDTVHSESEEVHSSFIGEVCLRWEEAVEDFLNFGSRVISLRTPMVLGEGGALDRMLPVPKFGLASPLGTGKHYMTWIHIDDLVDAYIFALQHDTVSGAMNIVADEQPSNADFMKCLAKVCRRPFFMPNVPSFVLKAMFGRMSSLLLEGSRVDNQKSKELGFAYRYQNLETALRDVID